MSDTRKAGSLILGNLAMFNEAAVLFEQTVYPEIAEKIDERLESYSSDGRWFRRGDLSSDLDYQLAPREWNRSGADESPDAKAWFHLTTEGAELGQDYKLAILTGVPGESAEFGFLFEIQYYLYGGRAVWKKYALNFDQESVDNLIRIGFRDLGAGAFFLPLHLKLDEVVKAWDDDDYTIALEPVDAAFAKLRESVQWLSKLLSLAPKPKQNSLNDATPTAAGEIPSFSPSEQSEFATD